MSSTFAAIITLSALQTPVSFYNIPLYNLGKLVARNISMWNSQFTRQWGLEYAYSFQIATHLIASNMHYRLLL